MKKLLLGLGYFTWIVCNLSIVYWLGVGAVKLVQSESFNTFLVHFLIGLGILLFAVIMSLLCLALVSFCFGDEKVSDKVIKWLPFLDI